VFFNEAVRSLTSNKDMVVLRLIFISFHLFMSLMLNK